MLKILNNVPYKEEIGEYGLLDIYIPDENSNNRTLLVYIHGGGLEGGDKSDEKDIFSELAMLGYTVVSPNYRMYPSAKFPDYIVDCADAVAWTLDNLNSYVSFGRIFIGGISAGAFLSMQLHFNKKYLEDVGVDESCIDGYIFDSGQPTVHFNVLREQGLDTSAIRIDETAAIYYVNGECNPGQQRYLFIVTDNDIPCRKEQNELMIQTMLVHGYSKDSINYVVFNDYTHASYIHSLPGERQVNGQKLSGYTEVLVDFMEGQGIKSKAID